MRNELKRFFDTGLYCLTGEMFSLGRNNIEVVGSMLDAGVKIVQYREKKKKAGAKLAECLKLREMTREAGAMFIVNDDIDIAMLVQADGVHIGQEDLPVTAVRSLVGPEMIIGLSTHAPDEAQKAVADGADYIGVGPVFPTQTKEDVCAAVGMEYLDYVVANIRIPFVAIGGIKEHNVAELVRRGTSCVAMITEVVGQDDIAGKIASLRNTMQGAGGK
jgi:thiamine-phosphate pyrophosphorylase